MNQATVLMARYVSQLLEHPPISVNGDTVTGVVGLGRTNIPRGDTQDLQIIIDSIAPATPLTDSSDYDGIEEVMTITQLFQAPMTIDFMGTAGYSEVVRFITLNRHQNGSNIRRALGIDVNVASRIQDLKFQQGEQYSERYQIEVNMTYNVTADIETLRIDESQLDQILTD